MNNTIKHVLNIFKTHPKSMNKIYIEAYKTMTLFPPRLNANKFIYGKVIETSIIQKMDKIFHNCINLDNTCYKGSSYKNDCNLFIDENTNIPISIKVCKNISNITLINKNSDKYEHIVDIDNMYFLILCITKKKIYFFNHNPNLDIFIKNQKSKIEYNRKIFKYLEHHKLYHSFILNNNQQKKINKIITKHKPIEIYDYIYNKFIK